MSEQGHRVTSGKFVADEIADEVAEEFEQPAAAETDVEEMTRWRTPGFQRLRTSWRPEEAMVLDSAKGTAEGRLLREFGAIFDMLERVYECVRVHAIGEDGRILQDQFGRPVWAQDENGRFIEDWSNLSRREKETFLFEMTTNLVFWQQQASDAWGEAMLAKTMWTERFSYGFDVQPKGTDERRKAQGHLDSRDEHYFAIFMSWYSRKADALVRSVELLGQRIKDSMN